MTKLPKLITVLILISNSFIYYNDRVSVIPSTDPSDPNLNLKSSKDQL